MNKLRLRLGAVELEYEGDESFSKTDILDILTQLAEIPPGKVAPEPGVTPSPAVNHSNGTFDLGVDSIASKIGATTAPDLLRAAALYLEAAKGKPTYSRQELHDAAKTASGYYNENVNKNLSNHLRSLVKSGKLHRRGDSNYSLSATTKAEMLTKIG